MGADVISQTQDRGEVEVNGKAGKGGHSRAGFLFFVLVGQNALCHNCLTSLVMEFGLQTYSIIPCIKGQRGFSLFLLVNGGRPKSTAYLCLGPRRTPGGQDSTKTTRKKVSRRDPQVGFVIQALSDALLGGNFG
jgi:hypothetical protein